MSVITSPPNPVTGSTTGLFQFTVDRYEQMSEVGILTEDDRVELLNGLVVAKMTKGQPHTAALIDTRDSLLPIIPPGWHLQTEAAIRIPDFDEPEPDLAVVRGKARDYVALNRPPEGSDVTLVIEIAETSLATIGVLNQPRSRWVESPSTGSSIWLTNKSRCTPTQAPLATSPAETINAVRTYPFGLTAWNEVASLWRTFSLEDSIRSASVTPQPAL